MSFAEAGAFPPLAVGSGITGAASRHETGPRRALKAGAIAPRSAASALTPTIGPAEAFMSDAMRIERPAAPPLASIAADCKTRRIRPLYCPFCAAAVQKALAVGSPAESLHHANAGVRPVNSDDILSN